MLHYLQPTDKVIVQGRSAKVISVWPDGELLRIEFTDTAEKITVSALDVRTPYEFTVAGLNQVLGHFLDSLSSSSAEYDSDDDCPDAYVCRGCGCELSGELSDLCRACDNEQAAESAADRRAER